MNAWGPDCTGLAVRSVEKTGPRRPDRHRRESVPAVDNGSVIESRTRVAVARVAAVHPRPAHRG